MDPMTPEQAMAFFIWLGVAAWCLFSEWRPACCPTVAAGAYNMTLLCISHDSPPPYLNRDMMGLAPASGARTRSGFVSSCAIDFLRV